MERSLDHNLRCPLCKQPLQEVQAHILTADLVDLVKRYQSCLVIKGKGCKIYKNLLSIEYLHMRFRDNNLKMQALAFVNQP